MVIVGLVIVVAPEDDVKVNPHIDSHLVLHQWLHVVRWYLAIHQNKLDQCRNY